MATNRQRTISRHATVTGFGLFGGADCTLRLCPAPPGHGIAFLRTDLRDARPIPAHVDYVESALRRTVLTDGHSRVEMVEHVMAALAGLWVDNCLVELDAPEPPVGDGSSWHLVRAILEAGIQEQDAEVCQIHVAQPFEVTDPSGASVSAKSGWDWSVSYSLDYGTGSPVPAQRASIEVTPENFVREIAYARTFVLASEIEGMQKLGFGLRVSTDHLLVVEADGRIRENDLHCEDEFARHKVLDAIGDLALCGQRVTGAFEAVRSGHHLNQNVAKRLKRTKAGAADLPLQEVANLRRAA